MPPSGFIKKETENIVSFAESLLHRFDEEVSQGIHKSVQEGIEKELAVIETHLQKANFVERGVLLLCKNMYLEYQKTSKEKIINDIKVLTQKKY